MFGWPWKSRSTSGTEGTRRYWWLSLMNFWNFSTIYVFEVEESNSDIITELSCLDDLENPGQLPVQEVLGGTDDCLLWIFKISPLFMFSRSRNPILTLLLNYHAWVTSKIQVNFRFNWYWWFCLINFWNFSTIYVFKVKESNFDIITELPCLGDLKNLGQLPVQGVLMILSYKFLKFLHNLCFWGLGSHCWRSYWATMFGCSRKSRSTSGSMGTDDSVL